MKIEFTIPLEPVAWQRVKRSGTGVAYVPAKTRSFKTAFGLLAKRYAAKPLEGPLHLTAVFFLKAPKKMPKGREYPDVRPDLDNYIKAIKDGGNGILWNDDGQICRITSGKYYASSVSNVGIFIRLETMTAEDRPFTWLR